MQKRYGLALFAGLAIILAACGGGGGSAAPSAGASGALKPIKVGVVTDVGQLEDKSFNQSSNEGALAAATQSGGSHDVIVTQAISDYAANIQTFVDQDFDVIVAAGFNLVPATAAAAKANPDIWFIGDDHAPCINATGDVDPTFADCSGDVAKLLPKYIAINYAEDQAGYLAGIVAGLATKSNTIGSIGGVSLCGPCIRYMQGYELGAKSVNPAITVKSAFVSDSDFKVGFADQAAGKTFGDQFITQNKGLDVLFQVAGLTGNGLVDAACAAKINAIGVDVDQHESYPASQACILTSAEKHLALSVNDSIVGIADGTAKGGMTFFNAKNDGIGVSPFYDAASKLPSDIQAKIDEATAGMKAGTVTTCPAKCGQLPVSQP